MQKLEQQHVQGTRPTSMGDDLNLRHEIELRVEKQLAGTEGKMHAQQYEGLIRDGFEAGTHK